MTAGTLLRKVCAQTQLTALVLDGRHAEHDRLGVMLLQHISVMHSLQQLCLTDVDLEDGESDVQRLFTDMSLLQDLQLTYCRLPIALAWWQVQFGQLQKLKVCQCDGNRFMRLFEAVSRSKVLALELAEGLEADSIVWLLARLQESSVVACWLPGYFSQNETAMQAIDGFNVKLAGAKWVGTLPCSG